MNDPEDEIRDLAARVLATYKGHPVWLVLAAHVACILSVDDEVPTARPALLGHLRNTVAVFEAMGDARGADAVAIMQAHAHLFGLPLDSEPPPADAVIH